MQLLRCRDWRLHRSGPRPSSRLCVDKSRMRQRSKPLPLKPKNWKPGPTPMLLQPTGSTWRACLPSAPSNRPPRGRRKITMPDTRTGDTRKITLNVNGEACTATVETRVTLVDFLRHELKLTGTHVGCEHGVCGACTVLVNGTSA